MSNDHDPEMQSWLRSEKPPEHGGGFWDDVRSDLDGDVAAVAPRPDARRHAPWLLVAAAVVVVAAVASFGVLGDRGDDVDVTTEPGIDDGEPTTLDRTPVSTPDSPPDSTTDGDLGPLVAVGEPTERGSGRVVSVSPDGRWLYIADRAEGAETGCEGAPGLALYVEPIDGGERRLAASVTDLVATTVSSLAFDGRGRVATVVQCEGFGARIVTGDVADDGTVINIEELTVPEPECHDGTVDGIVDIAYTGAGELVAATSSFGDGTTVCRHLYSLSDSGSEPTPLADRDLIQIEAAPGAPMVSATIDGVVTIDGAVVYELGQGGVADMSMAPSGSTVAISGGVEGADDVVISIADRTSARFATDAYEVAMVDDVNGIMTADIDGVRALATFRAGDPEASTSLIVGNISGFAVSPAGDRVLASVSDDTGENPRILEITLAR